jgi:hypothetical protein
MLWKRALFKNINDTFLTPMADTMAAMLDAYVEKIPGPNFFQVSHS